MRPTVSAESRESSNTTDAWLEPSQRRQATYLHLQELVAGRDVVELWSESADGRGAATLSAKGARRVTTVAAAAAAQVSHTIGTPERTGLPNASADVVIALDASAAALAAVVREARRLLRPEGVLVLGVPSRDRPGATSGASYYDVVDACGEFARVQMIGLAPFAGATLVEYGVADPEPILDGTLVDRGERVEHYVAVAGPDRRGDFGYGVVQVPVASIARATTAHDDAPLRATIARLETQLAEAQKRGSAKEIVRATEAPPSNLLREALERHAGEMRAREIELAERDAYILELEIEGRRAQEREGQLARSEAARAEAETKEREARRKIAELEGQLLGGRGAGPSADVAAELASLRKKVADSEAESWKQLKARSEAETAVAEMRDDMVRKLKDARKLATVELTRAMEEATKKAVSLKDELTRSENERKAAVAQLKALQAAGENADVDSTHRRDLARAREEGEASALAAKAAGARALADVEAARHAADASVREAEERVTQLGGRLASLERAMVGIERERDEARAALAAEQARAQALLAQLHEVPGAASHGEEHAAQAKVAAEQTQQIERLRAELQERDRKERERPSKLELDRMRAEVEPLRTKVAELTHEIQRRDSIIERTASAAAHERARSERLVASERQALGERNDARARMAEATARAAAVENERERTMSALEAAEARVHKAENEIKDRRERVRRLKRELADAERRANAGIQRVRTLENVRARVQALEAAVIGEARHLAGIEASLRAP